MGEEEKEEGRNAFLLSLSLSCSPRHLKAATIKRRKEGRIELGVMTKPTLKSSTENGANAILILSSSTK